MTDATRAPTRRALPVDHVGITVSDLSRSIAFYARHFGLRESARGELLGPEAAAAVGVPGAALTWVLLEGGGTRVELLEYRAPRDGHPDAPRNHDVGAAHVCFRVEDLAAACAALRADGVDVLTPYADPPFAYARDPDGITVELVQRDAPPGAAPRP
jgi:catechol 2,3-dioxygenase-like lactoylglutathione lyase family enzyme